MEICTDPRILKVTNLFLTLLDIIKIIVPVILIVVGTIDMFKTIVSGDENKQKQNANLFMKRLLYAVLVFFVPSIINYLIVMVNDSTSEINFTDCVVNSKNIDYYEKLYKEKQQKELEKIKLEKEKQELVKKENEALKKNQISNTSTDGSFIGQKYALTDSQLRGIASLCQQEQGTAEGAAAEASLMANRFELFGSKHGQGANGLYNHIQKSGWWHNASKYMQGTPRNDILTAVYEVLVLGKRTLPLYVDEHDCIYCGKYGYDVTKIVTGSSVITDKTSLKNRNNYKSDATVIYNRYGSIYTFHSFPTETSDPFGYTESAKNKFDSLNK